MFVVIGYATIDESNPLNTKDCGVSVLTSEVDNNCFEWHKEMIPKLIDARPPIPGETPWMAHIIITFNETFSHYDNETVEQ